jgi:putative SOS response-associated peptidase YedK
MHLPVSTHLGASTSIGNRGNRFECVERDLGSFAAVTDEPPAEIAATGHQRCIISLREENVAEWLNPQHVDTARLEQILSDRQAPYYEHRIAA